MSSRSSKTGKAFQGIQKRPIPNEMETEGLTPHTPPHPAVPPPPSQSRLYSLDKRHRELRKPRHAAVH